MRQENFGDKELHQEYSGSPPSFYPALTVRNSPPLSLDFQVMCNYIEEVRSKSEKDAKQGKPWHPNAKIATQVPAQHLCWAPRCPGNVRVRVWVDGKWELTLHTYQRSTVPPTPPHRAHCEPHPHLCRSGSSLSSLRGERGQSCQT